MYHKACEQNQMKRIYAAVIMVILQKVYNINKKNKKTCRQTVKKFMIG